MAIEYIIKEHLELQTFRPNTHKVINGVFVTNIVDEVEGSNIRIEVVPDNAQPIYAIIGIDTFEFKHKN